MKKKFINLFLSIISTLSLFLNFKKVYLNKSGIINIWSTILIIIFIVIFYLFYNKIDLRKNSKEDKLLSTLFSIFTLIGQSYRSVSSLSILFKKYMFVFTIFRFIGLYFIFLLLIYYYRKCINIFKMRPDLKENKFIKVFNKHPFLISLSIICLAWLIYYIAFYPAVLSPDPSYQIKQAFNVRTKYNDYSIQINPKVNITNHHPVFHTLLLGGCIRLGRIILNDNFGLFIYTFTQGMFLAITLAYTVLLLKKKNVQNKYLIPLLLIYSFVPCFPFYAINMNKDVYYTTFIIWLIILLIKYIECFKNSKVTKAFMFQYFVVSIFLCLFRNNGIFLILVLLPFLYKFSKKNRVIILLITLFITGLYYSYTKVLLPKLGVTGTSVREVLSIPFQQSARYIKYYEDEISLKDKENIGKVLNYEVIKTSYDPQLSDPVKNTYNKYATKKDLLNYFDTWAHGFIKRPFLYIDATLNNIYGFFDPGDIHWYIYSGYNGTITENGLVDYHYNNLKILRVILKNYAYAFKVIPVLGLIVIPGFNTWILLYLIIYILKSKKKDEIIILLPMIISLVFCVLGPANNYYRYAMPYIFSMPFMIVYYLNKKVR